MDWQEWLNAVRHIPMAELRCDVPPTPELLAMIDQVGLYQWEAYCQRLERLIVRNGWVWPEESI